MKFSAFSSFFGLDDQQRTTTTPKSLFKDTYTMVGTQNWHVWVKHDKHKVWVSICFSLPANSLFLSALKTSISSLSKKSISHEHVNITGISYQQRVFPLFHNVRFSSRVFVTFENIRKFESLQYNEIPHFNPFGFTHWWPRQNFS